MKDDWPTEPVEIAEPPPPHYASFILRCWTGGGGQMRVRLIDVRSGADCSLDDITELPAVVRRMARDTSAEEPTR